jgi:hypothetical protein
LGWADHGRQRFNRSDGNKVWQQSLDAPTVFSGLAVANEAIFVTLEAGTIRCFGPP